MKRDFEEDLHAVRSEHVDIHERCLNWSAYVRDTPTLSGPAPMFRYYRPYLVPRESSSHNVDGADAMVIERAVQKLPERHAYAVRWCYVFPWRNEDRVRRVLALTKPALRFMIHDARSMLRNTVGK